MEYYQAIQARAAQTAAVINENNALGPFAVGKTVKLRTRVKNSTGSTTGSVRTLKIV